ncbi:unnamed protein product [Ilex paraguariensis]|uniref:non-specific serine/threonine protein kinase n=1 Tax=Ilex paraguariensis TaxID=185542 RepID=A0ABC8SCD0_9AQUA
MGELWSVEEPKVVHAFVDDSYSWLTIVLASSDFCLGPLVFVEALILGRMRFAMFVAIYGEDDCKISFGQLKKFTWREMQLATDNFSESNIIGQGGFGKVYKAILPDNTKVAVKRLVDYHSPGGEAAFLREVQLISVAVHRNLLRLIGFCTTRSERILVYPFMQNLSVAYRLRGTYSEALC